MMCATGVNHPPCPRDGFPATCSRGCQGGANMTALIVIVVLAVLIIGWVIMTYNRLVA